MTTQNFAAGVGVALALLLFADPFVNSLLSLLQTATLDSMTRGVLSIFFDLALSPFGVVGGLIGWVALSRRNA